MDVTRDEIVERLKAEKYAPVAVIEARDSMLTVASRLSHNDANADRSYRTILAFTGRMLNLLDTSESWASEKEPDQARSDYQQARTALRDALIEYDVMLRRFAFIGLGGH